jgi:hypothetical protein
VTPRPLLTAAAAREAFVSVAEARIGADAPIELERVTRSTFNGYAAWPAGGDTPPVCQLKLTAELQSSGVILVTPRGVTCAT